MAKVSKPILLEETYREQSTIQNGYLKQIADTLTGQSTQESTASLSAAAETDTAKQPHWWIICVSLMACPSKAASLPKMHTPLVTGTKAWSSCWWSVSA